jgi:hypothetical protein
MKSWKKPTPEQVDHAVALLARPAQYRYFFGHLDNPQWVRPLVEKGFFKSPPAAQKNEKEGTIAFPPWAESQFLARVANTDLPEAQEAVLNAIKVLPDTDNMAVIADCIEAANLLPPDCSVQLTQRVVEWSKKQYPFLLPEKLGQFIAHLSRAGRIKEALQVAGTTLDVVPDPRFRVKKADEEHSFFHPEPIALFDHWNYEQLLKKHLPELVKAAQESALELICGLLEKAIRLSGRSDGPSAAAEFSYIWRPAVEDHGQNLNMALRESLVSAVRDSVEHLANGHPEKVPDLVLRLVSRKQQIFDRIALHLLRMFPAAAPELIAETLVNKKNFDEPGLRHEYVLLLERCFGTLPAELQAEYLEWVKAGPEIELFKERATQVFGSEPTNKQTADYISGWQRDRLAPISQYLYGDWKTKYDDLVKAVGQPDHPEFLTWHEPGGFVGLQSPMEAKELSALTIGDLIKYLQTWKSGNDWMGPSEEGLGNQLKSLVVDSPEKYLPMATAFKGLDPTYVRCLIEAAQEIAKKGLPFDWEPIIQLSQWVVEQPREIPGRKGGIRERDPDWSWTRRSIGSLLSTGLQKQGNQVPFNLRDKVWGVIRILTEDLEPNLEFEAEFGGSNMEPAAIALNTVRGQAIQTAIRYALWVRSNFELSPNGKELLERGFDKMAEVRAVLEAHLDPTIDPAASVRAVYGQWFPWLTLLDENWARENKTKIFPIEADNSNYWRAAWWTYIAFCEPYDVSLDILQTEYSKAVNEIGVSRSEERVHVNPDERLAWHMMVYYWRGRLNLENDQNLLHQFYRKAPAAIRGLVLEFVGRSLKNSPNQIPSGILERLKQLWDWRLSEAKKADATAGVGEELQKFGWWFASAKFDDEWSIIQLTEVLKVSGTVEPYHLVTERLAGMAENTLGPALECLDLLIRNDKEGWRVSVYRNHVRTILAAALLSKVPSVSQMAVNLVNYLGELGYFDFGDLLKRGAN